MQMESRSVRIWSQISQMTILSFLLWHTRGKNSSEVLVSVLLLGSLQCNGQRKKQYPLDTQASAPIQELIGLMLVAPVSLKFLMWKMGRKITSYTSELLQESSPDKWAHTMWTITHNVNVTYIPCIAFSYNSPLTVTNSDSLPISHWPKAHS